MVPEGISVLLPLRIVKPRSFGTIRSDLEYSDVSVIYSMAKKTTLSILKEVYPILWGQNLIRQIYEYPTITHEISPIHL